MSDRRRGRSMLVVLLVAAVSVVATAAPVAANGSTLEYEAVVTADGEVETIDMVMTDDQEVYEMLNWSATNAGYENVSDMVGAELVGEDPMFGDYTAEDREVDDGYESRITITAVDHSASENMSVTTDDGALRWELFNVEGMDGGEYDEVTFTVRMPTDVTVSNADEVSDESAVWNLTADRPSELYVESAVDADSGDADEDGTTEADETNDDTDSEDGLPGLGVVTALAGLLGAVFLITRRAD